MSEFGRVGEAAKCSLIGSWSDFRSLAGLVEVTPGDPTASPSSSHLPTSSSSITSQLKSSTHDHNPDHVDAWSSVQHVGQRSSLTLHSYRSWHITNPPDFLLQPDLGSLDLDDEVIQCFLSLANLQYPECLYEALSYEWGMLRISLATFNSTT